MDNLTIAKIHIENKNWIEAEKIYLEELVKSQDKIDFYHQLGMIQEQLNKYDNAIDSYTMAIFSINKNYDFSSYRLAYLLTKTFQYKESCSTFLMRKKMLFPIKKILENRKIKITNHKNKFLVYDYILTLDLLDFNSWKKIGEKAKILECWDIAEYAYKKYLNYFEDFDKEIYFSLGYVLTCQEKYEDASIFFKEQKRIHCLDIFNNEDSMEIRYLEYFKRFEIEENIIVYSNINELTNQVFLLLKNDVKFDTYLHVFIVENNQNRDYPLVNRIYISRNSDLYLRYLSKGKYFVSNQKFPSFFKQKKNQIIVKKCEQKSIELIFFTIIDSPINIKYREEFSSLYFIYKSAIELFNERKWKLSFEQFFKLSKKLEYSNKNFPILYYKKESEIRYLIEDENQTIEELLSYFHHKFDAENFAGVEYLIDKAIENSISYAQQWKLLKVDFLDFLEDIKETDESLWTSLKGQGFINKIKKLSKNIDNQLEAHLLPYQVWFLFSNLFIFAHLYTKYQIVRTKARDSILLVKEIANNPFARYKINALLETNQEKEYRLLREKLLENNSNYVQKYLQLLGLSEFYFYKITQNREFYSAFFTDKEKEFASYIENKSIAIVGPLDLGVPVGAEIDTYDVVLRFNYSGLEKFSKEIFGEKTDISFYIAEILLKDELNISKISYMNQLDWVIIDTAHEEEDICFLGLDTNIRKRYSAGHAFATTMLKGAPSGIQRVIMDLLRFKTGRIKVFNTNLFLENNYAKAYKSRGKLGADYFNFFWHDPLSNFIFLKRLENNRVIDADNILSEILQMSEDGYIDALELRYGIKNDK